MQALDRHTLAVRLAGAEAVDLQRPLGELARKLETNPRKVTGSDGQRAVEASLLRSVRALPDESRRLFTALSVFAVPEFGRQVAIAVAEALELPLPDEQVDLLVRRAVLEKATEITMPKRTDRERLQLHPCCTN